MAYNKIPLALAYDDNTGNASGLVEFTLGLSDVGDVCDTAPEQGQALVFSGTEWCPSTLPAPGEFTGNLSDVGQVCSAAPTNGQVLTWSGNATGEWCPSTVATGGGGSVNLGYNAATTSGEVTNSGGSNATILAAGVANAGLFLASEKTKLAGIEAAAEVNVQADWNETTTDDDAFINNKPTVPTDNSELFNGAGFTTTTAVAGTYATITNLGATTATANAALPEAGGTITGNLAIEGTLKSTSVYENSLVITTGASAVSSLSGASGTIPYFEGTTPAPGLKTFAQILTNENYNISPGATYQPLNARLTDLSTTFSRGDILYYDGSNLVTLAITSGSPGDVLKINTSGNGIEWGSP